jgi:hypothetical protein
LIALDVYPWVIILAIAPIRSDAVAAIIMGILHASALIILDKKDLLGGRSIYVTTEQLPHPITIISPPHPVALAYLTYLKHLHLV